METFIKRFGVGGFSSGGLMRRLVAATLHLGFSVTIAALAGILVFALWYPYPYNEISGGRELFLLVLAVDVIMGPLMTLTVFNRAKTRAELFRDMVAIGVLQLAALAYGLWTVSLARPVFLVFEVDRFRVVHAVEVFGDPRASDPIDFQRLPLTGPKLLGLRDFKNSQESFNITMAELEGLSISYRPEMWQSFEKVRPQVTERARPIAELKERFPQHIAAIDKVIAAHKAGTHAEEIGYLPMMARSTIWTVLVDRRTADVIGFVPIDSF